MLKKYMLIEVFSGSCNKENVEHELLNDQKSHITGSIRNQIWLFMIILSTC